MKWVHRLRAGLHVTFPLFRPRPWLCQRKTYPRLLKPYLCPNAVTGGCITFLPKAVADTIDAPLDRSSPAGASPCRPPPTANLALGASTANLALGSGAGAGAGAGAGGGAGTGSAGTREQLRDDWEGDDWQLLLPRVLAKDLPPRMRPQEVSPHVMLVATRARHGIAVTSAACPSCGSPVRGIEPEDDMDAGVEEQGPAGKGASCTQCGHVFCLGCYAPAHDALTRNCTGELMHRRLELYQVRGWGGGGGGVGLYVCACPACAQV